MAGSLADNALWLRSFHPSPGAGAQLVCFPHAGGSASSFFSLSRSLTPEIDVLSVQYPGRQDRRREECVGDITELAELAFGALDADARIEYPFAFLGHSMGAIVAFEVALRFARRTGRGPIWLFVSGRRAPSRRRDEGLDFDDDASVVARLRELGGTNEQFLEDEELLATILPVARNDYRAIENYAGAPDATVDCPITALVGDRDPQTTIDEASAWEKHSSKGFDLRVFPGSHFFLEEHQSGVTSVILASLRG
ncbi:thioesterase II family protein [Allosalinactinospora lopnorensis]|uniref:thioesterase II family protein n=1 Tax=Allosalinactinospora lopnorensis TaxID=1352348 RepID=UPI000623E17D|nr:alpha/beta fold hydrolase [Allosalinactinospora lopnorensis]